MSIGNGSRKLVDLALDAVGKIGVPGLLCLVFLYGFWMIGQRLADGHIEFLKAAARTMDRHRDEDAALHALFQKLAEGQAAALLRQAEMEKNQQMLMKLLGDLKRP